MASNDAYVLKEKDVKFLKELFFKFRHLQHYTNAFGRGEEHSLNIDDNSATTQIYIARSGDSAIPALTSAGITGINDIPGSQFCDIFKIKRNTTFTDVLSVGYQKEIFNLGDSPIPEHSWMIVVRDKHGDWYGLPVNGGGGNTGTIRGPGWTAGLSQEDCLRLTVSRAIGKCSTIDDSQTFLLLSEDGVVWQGVQDFVYSGGMGPVIFTRPDCQALPTLQIDGFCLIWDKAGDDGDGNCYIEYMGGTSLCSDVPGTGSGTGGPREGCCSNTFTIRLTCTTCPTCDILGTGNLTADVVNLANCGCMASTGRTLVYTTGIWEDLTGWGCGEPGTPGTINFSCTDNGGNGTVTLSIIVTCGTSNTGSASVVVPLSALYGLDQTFTVPIGSSGCTGLCTWRWNGMSVVWELQSDTCAGECEICDISPANPPVSPVDGQLHSENCIPIIQCCIGSISIRVRA